MATPSTTQNMPNFGIMNSRPLTQSNGIPQRGFQGPQGLSGEDGCDGDDGVQGPQGVEGPRGFLGGMGMQGYQGFIGPQGPSGNLSSSSQKNVVSNYESSMVDLEDSFSDLVSISGTFNNPYITSSVVCQSSTSDVVVEFNILRDGEQVIPYSYYYTMKKAGGYKTINLQFQDNFVSKTSVKYTLVAKGKSDAVVKVSLATIFVQ
jgi:hypothetical protein